MEKLQHPNPAESTHLTWEQILREEPYEGQHWEGAFGLPPGSTVEGWEAISISSPSLSDDGDISENGILDEDRQFAIRTITPLTSSETEDEYESHDVNDTKSLHARNIFDVLSSRQYWRTTWRDDLSPAVGFNLGNPASLGELLPSSLYARHHPFKLSV